MKENQKYGFWFWKEQFRLIISAISMIIEYDILEEEFELIKEELRGTNDEKDNWGSYLLSGKKHQLKIKLAYDAEEGFDMIHISTPANGELLTQLKTLDLIKDLFQEEVFTK